MFAMRCRSYGARHYLCRDSYKDFAPTELTSVSAKSPNHSQPLRSLRSFAPVLTFSELVHNGLRRSSPAGITAEIPNGS
jgi:hypothetical protein